MQKFQAVSTRVVFQDLGSEIWQILAEIVWKFDWDYLLDILQEEIQCFLFLNKVIQGFQALGYEILHQNFITY